MSGRFWISGVQLGLVIEFDKAQRKALVNKIADEQYLGKKRDKIVEEVISEKFRQNKEIRKRIVEEKE